MFQLIQNQEELRFVLNKMNHCAVYGLDTEFIKVDTLWPKLGVLQINIADEVYLLDGTTLDLSEFWHKLFHAEQNVFHACSEDIDLIYYYAQHKSLDNVFDTQVGMSFLGHGLQVSYQSALKHMLNVDIDKGETRSNWLARPLSAAQLKYAANDVIYLMDLAEKVKQELNAKSLLNYVLEDCQHLTQEIATQTPTSLLYQEIGHYRHSRRQLMQLQQLAVWREHMVRVLNIPRSFILKNSTMIDLVEKNPKNTFQLSTIKDIRPNVVREYGKTILDLIKGLPEQSCWPLRLVAPTRHASKEVAEEIDGLIQKIADQTSIPKEVLMRKKWMSALHIQAISKDKEQNLPAYLLGWRYELLTRPVMQLLHRHTSDLFTL